MRRFRVFCALFGNHSPRDYSNLAQGTWCRCGYVFYRNDSDAW